MRPSWIPWHAFCNTQFNVIQFVPPSTRVPSEEWPSGSTSGPLRLASDAVHVWCHSLTAAPDVVARHHAKLSAVERDRSSRYRFDHDRRHFIVAHGALRDILARYLDIAPADVVYAYGARGKPELALLSGVRLRFNLTHSAGLALIAVAEGADVGVDLERVSADDSYLEIAREFFSPAEADRLVSLPKRVRAEAFTDCWTKKEAYLKARGDGLGVPMRAFSLPTSSGPPLEAVECGVRAGPREPVRSWTFLALRPAPGYLGALAIEGGGWRAIRRRWSEPS